MVAIPIRVRIFPMLLVFLLRSTQIAATGICYKSIISFGDSLADTGNLLNLLPASNRPPHFSLPPYGRTFFHHPSGRFSDGRLVIDFIAESLGLPLVSPYFEREEAEKEKIDFGEGVNFAVAGATALEDSFFRERGIGTGFANVSLANQIHWFKQMFASLCQKSTDCKEFLGSSLILMGEIGGNDYNHPLLHGRSIQEVRSFVPHVVRAIATAIHELIKLGAKTLLVPGNLPIGCNSAYLTYFRSSDEKDYDAFGCLKWLNKFSKYHNKMLQNELNRLREIHHPSVNIIYGDYYNAATKIYRSPNTYRFNGDLSACCGGGGPYNYNESLVCGDQQSSCCDDPSLYFCWDGLHFTEAAYQWIAKELLQGLYAMSTSCTMSLPLPSDIPKLIFQD